MPTTGAYLAFIDFFFQAEDGIRDHCVTGVQTCALPISGMATASVDKQGKPIYLIIAQEALIQIEKIGRASCRERVEVFGAYGVNQQDNDMVQIETSTSERDQTVREVKSVCETNDMKVPI